MGNKELAKPLKEYLCDYYRKQGYKLKSCHAYELVAWCFGYRTYVAMKTDTVLNMVSEPMAIALIRFHILRLEKLPLGTAEAPIIYDLVKVKLRDMLQQSLAGSGTVKPHVDTQ